MVKNSLIKYDQVTHSYRQWSVIMNTLYQTSVVLLWMNTSAVHSSLEECQGTLCYFWC